MNTTIQNTTKYKNSPLGLIPEDWEVRKLGKLGEIISGLTYAPEDINENGVLVLRSSNVQNRQLKFNDNVYVNVKNGKYNPITENDILICVRNGSKSLIGKNTLITKQVEGVAFGAFMAVFRSAQNKYLFQLFDTDYYNSEIHKNLGATINSINGSDLKQFKFPIPPPDEQTAIANCLSTWDKAIEKQNALIAQKQLSKKALMQQLLSGKKRLKGFSGEWKEVRLGDMGKIISGLTYSPDDVKTSGVLVLRSSNIQEKQVDFKSCVYVDVETDGFNPVKSGDILICVRNGSKALIGKNVIITNEIEGAAFGAFMAVFRSDFNNYLIQLFDTDYYYREINKNLGATINSINGSDLKLFKFPIPPIEEQTAIAKILQCADDELQLLKKKLEQLKEQKKGLMQVLLTGKKRLKY